MGKFIITNILIYQTVEIIIYIYNDYETVKSI